MDPVTGQNGAPSVSAFDRLLRAFGHIPVLPKGVRVRGVNLFRRTDEVPDRRFAVPFFGMIYKGSLACEIDKQVFFFGAYERELLDLCGNLLSGMESPVVADIGANVGHHSLYFSRYASHVHSFEPWQKVREQIARHMSDNGIRNITIHPLALGAEDESRIYYAPTGGNSGTGSFVPTHARDRNRPAGELRIAEGDRYFASNGIDKLDLIKIDVEGWEWFVLLGLRKTIARLRPLVLFEHSRSTQIHLRERSGLNIFSDYELYSVKKQIEHVETGTLPLGNLLLVPAEKQHLLRPQRSHAAVLGRSA